MRIKGRMGARACALLLCGAFGIGCIATGCTGKDTTGATQSLAPASDASEEGAPGVSVQGIADASPEVSLEIEEGGSSAPASEESAGT